MPITLKQLRAAEWKKVYAYQGEAMAFDTFATDAIPHLTVTHTRRKLGGPVSIAYAARGRRTDSPSQAVRYWNEEERKIQQFQYAASINAKSSRRM